MDTSNLIYLSDVTDAEWAVLEPLVTPATRRGRPRLHPLRRILNAIFSLMRRGCAWRLLPRDLPPWKTVYHYFRKWWRDGTLGTHSASPRAGQLPATSRLHTT